MTRDGIQGAAEEYAGVVGGDAGTRHLGLGARMKAFLVSYVAVVGIQAAGIEAASFEARRIRGGKA